MAEYLVTDTDLKAVADAIRAKFPEIYTIGDIAELKYLSNGGVVYANTASFISHNVFARKPITEIIASSVEIIMDSAFANCSSLTTASFPAATSIGVYAFASCSKLATISFPATISINTYAFASCSSLTTASFPVATKIGSFAFYRCSRLTTASFPVTTSIGSYAFNYCSSLTTASFPAATDIGNSAFYYCRWLSTANFPVATTIGSYAFENCSSLTTASFPVATYIWNGAFRYCNNLTSLYITNVSSVITLGSSVFVSTPIGGYTASTGGVYGSVFVPASLYSSFLTATNWASISARIVSV